MAKHVDLRFAGVSDEELATVVREYDEWNRDGFVQDDAVLRRLSVKFGPANSVLAMSMACTMVFREIIARQARQG